MQLKRFQSFCLAAILSGFTAHAADQALIQLEIEQTPLSLPEKDTRTMALELQRPSNQDILFLSNGDKLTGTILNESLGIRTDFGTLKFSNQVIEGEDVRMMVKVNNRLSGFLEDRMIQFKLQFGPQIEIPSEKILTAVFGLRVTERQRIFRHQFIVLKNGDFFLGNILNDQISMVTPYANVALKLEAIQSLTFMAGQNPPAKAILRNQDQLQGVLETESFEVQLDVGTTVMINPEQIDVIYGRRDFVSDPARFATGGRTIRIGNRADDAGYDFEQTPEGLRIVSVAPGSLYHGFFQPGDIVAALNGEKYRPGTLTPLREKVVAGRIARILLKLKRGNQELYYSIVR